MRRNLLKARYPSIVTCNLASSTLLEIEEPKSDEEKTCIQVYLRLKAGIEDYDKLYEIKDSLTLISKVPEGSHSARNTKTGDFVNKKYYFSKIFGPETTQEEIFHELVKPRLSKFIFGQNCTLMTYGVSSSGKTYTIVGTADQPGILPRSLEHLFKTFPKLTDHPIIKPTPNGGVIKLGKEQAKTDLETKESVLNFNWPNTDRTEHINTYCKMQSRLSEEPAIVDLENIPDISVAVWVSFAEIYNEHVYDLLQPELPHGKKREKLKLGSSNGVNYIKNLRQIYVSSGLEAYQVLQYGLNHLNYAETNINNHSSRSHSIFTIELVKMNNEDEKDFNVSHFNFCDLAGAERSKKTLNVGQRLKESNNINTSLLVLRRCITGVRNSQKASDHRLIPFRESKLTQIFQKALSGQEDICMIVNINPCIGLFDETQHVLSFSAIAKEIQVIRAPKPPSAVVRRFTEHIQRMSVERHEESVTSEIQEKERQIQDLKDQIADYINKTEIEEAHQTEQIVEVRSKYLARYTQIQKEQNEAFERELADAREQHSARNRQIYLEAKMKESNIFREKFNDSLEWSSEEEDEFLDPPKAKKRKVSSDIETIVLSSSEDEDELDDLKSTIEKQKEKIEEHHRTIAMLEVKISMLQNLNRDKIEELEQKIRLKERRIQELSVQQDEGIVGRTDIGSP